MARWKAMRYEPNSWALEHVHGREERFIIGTTARQVGKTETAAIEIDEGMNERKFDDRGELVIPWVGVIAPTYDKAELSINKYIEHLTKTFGPESYRMNQNKHILTIVDPQAGVVGARLQWLSCDDPYSVIGFTFTRLVGDECQNIPDEVWYKLRPALDVMDAPVRLFGTPDVNATQSWFRGMWMRGQDGDYSNYHSFTVTCFDNKWMSTEAILEAKEQLSNREFRMLYLGEWVDTEGTVFTNVDGCVLTNPPPFDPKKRYAMAVDLAVFDDFNVVIIQEEATRVVVHMERWHQTEPLQTEDRIVSIWEKWGQPRVTADETGMGIPMVAGLRRRGLKVFGVTIGANNKMEMVGWLASDIEHRRILYPNLPALVSELKAFVFKRTPTGKLTASSISGYHDDCVMTLVILNSLTRRGISSGNTPQNYLLSREPSLDEMLRRIA